MFGFSPVNRHLVLVLADVVDMVCEGGSPPHLKCM